MGARDGTTARHFRRELFVIVSDPIERDTCIPSDVAPNAK